ncbi:hypothetical protein CLV42_101387 [Chitinophaga ginsengisoli]|uniref:Uncharacterized protein n=1 Tax=Chitinophaga ginsengisoli TaxID=363837 RepID=A0A2P8GNV9_9BACT|nr:hypothetical protein CLV42_101387 [Chitinophaga ginsengisoli]
MENTLQETILLNSRLREELEKTGCVKGRLKAELTTTLLISLSCIKTGIISPAYGGISIIRYRKPSGIISKYAPPIWLFWKWI